MGRKSNYSIEEKVQAVLDYKNGARSISNNSRKIKIYKCSRFFK